MDTKSFGQAAYEGYYNASGGKSLISGAPLPTWEAQVQVIREAWEAAANAAISAWSGQLPGFGGA